MSDYFGGMGSWVRGVYRCWSYCSDNSASQNMQRLARAMREDPKVKVCIEMMIGDYVDSNKAFLSGRLTFPAAAVVVPRILTRGRAKIGGAVGASSGFAFFGDLNYSFSFDGGLSPQNIARAIAGSMGGDGEAEISCECQEVLSELTP